MILNTAGGRPLSVSPSEPNSKQVPPISRTGFSLTNTAVGFGPTKSRPEPSGTVRTEPLGAVRTPPGAVPTPPVIQLLNIQKEINRTQITCSLLAQYLHFVMYKTILITLIQPK